MGAPAFSKDSLCGLGARRERVSRRNASPCIFAFSGADPCSWLGFASNSPGVTASPDLISPAWLKPNVQLGPLGAKYPDIAFAMEGDTPSYLSLIPVGPFKDSPRLLISSERIERPVSARLWWMGRTLRQNL